MKCIKIYFISKGSLSSVRFEVFLKSTETMMEQVICSQTPGCKKCYRTCRSGQVMVKDITRKSLLAGYIISLPTEE